MQRPSASAGAVTPAGVSPRSAATSSPPPLPAAASRASSVRAKAAGTTPPSAQLTPSSTAHQTVPAARPATRPEARPRRGDDLRMPIVHGAPDGGAPAGRYPTRPLTLRASSCPSRPPVLPAGGAGGGGAGPGEREDPKS